MPTKQSKQLRSTFCRRAKRRNTTATTFYDRIISRSQKYQKEHNAMLTLALPKMYYSNYDDGPRQALKQTMPPKTLASPLISQPATFSRPLSVQRASSREICGLALGICFLVLLMGWLLLVGIRVSIRSLHEGRGKATRKMDLECCRILEERPTIKDSSLLSKLRKISAEELIKSAWRKGTDLAASIRRDACELGRPTYPIPAIDEETGLGVVGNSGIQRRGSFLRTTCRGAGVLSV
ncbi:uncharacterized protein F4812DRAFT_336365 [Daldinia caldariorum]|uniref:uncharacterized protein n=1 Tax=Daldinia caldariorum TaxID=326644 RepID=UPI002007E597|nr:uncharacterized protein F4812DRAFT_336365 [Daldinia caldariorum]KAI1469587.1 hypothetical protein F4812DRAFT_336365 [Daldinia caldariorum]